MGKRAKEPIKVKCADCGFLCLFNYEYGSYMGADYSYRTKGFQGGILTSGLACEPHCSVYAEDLHHEPFSLCGERIQFTENGRQNLFTNEQGKTVTTEAVLDIVSRPRDCADFSIPWRQGFTPKEHSEMLDRQRWQEWQEKQRSDDKKWRIKELLIIVFATVILAGVFTILGAFIERGSLFPPP